MSMTFARQCFLCVILMLNCLPTLEAKVLLGIDVLLRDNNISKLKNRKIGLITNHTAINGDMRLTHEILSSKAKDFKIVALFAPEHGIFGKEYAENTVKGEQSYEGIPVYSLYGETKRPTQAMLKDIDLLIYDIQDIGSRSYTYITTLFYVMEEAAKRGIPVLVLDRPNPINGLVVDGPMLEADIRSIVGYINVPYCYGLTIGELATYFNQEYKIACRLEVIPMKGWRRSMSFKDTGLPWIPTSPHIPESDTALYYPITGILGELGMVNIGVGYTLPFKLIGAPWINAEEFAKAMNQQNLPAVNFFPFRFRPFYGKFVNENCQGILISVTDSIKYKPLTIQYAILSTLKRLYPKKFEEAISSQKHRRKMFAQVLGTDKMWSLMQSSAPLQWNLRLLHEAERKAFMEKRRSYLLLEYSSPET